MSDEKVLEAVTGAPDATLGTKLGSLPQNDIKGELRKRALRNAQAALSNMNKPAEPAPAAPVEAPAAPAVVAAPVVAPPVQQPVAPLPPAPVEAGPSMEVLKQGWGSINAAQKKLAEDRAATKKEHEAALELRGAAEKDRLRLVELEAKLRADPLAGLTEYGWNPQKLAQNIIEKHQNPSQQASVAQAPQSFQTVPAGYVPADQYKALEERQSRIEAHLMTQAYSATLKQPGLELLAGEPDGMNRAMNIAAAHYQDVGNVLTIEQACAIAQDELVAQLRTRLTSNPHLQKALGFNGSAAPAQGQPGTVSGAQQTQTAPTPNEPPITSLSNDIAPAASIPVPAGARPALTEKQRLERAKEAIQKARNGA